MRLLFDALSYGTRPSGTRTRVLGLVPELVGLGLDIGILAGPGWSADEEARLDGATFVRVPDVPRGPLSRWWRQARIHRRAQSEYHCDFVVSECLPWPATDRLIGVVHDLRWRRDTSWAARARRRALIDGCARARQIHVVSPTTAAQLAAVLPESVDHLRVVPNGVDVARFTAAVGPTDDAILERRGLRPGYVLCVGHFEPRKAPDVAIAVRTEMAKRYVDVPLVMVGRGALLPEEGMCALKGQFPNQDAGRVLRDVTAEELPALYRGAGVVLAPSRDEGFGIAPLEALACGAPVVASDIPTHRDVLGDAARLCRVDDVSVFVGAVLSIVEQGADAPLVTGPAQAARWTWKAAAESFVQAIDEAGRS
ncbi:MAG: hypothetical protein CMJ83_12610 [Planctomycetes bacterium]|nr:hypothetical protein [Planctomycetota bacterium]